MTGYKPSGRADRRITELGLEDLFILAGRRDDLDRFIPHWNLCVLPSFTEGLPTVVLESCAAGVPVVATAGGGTPEAVADGVDGYLVPPGDPAALALPHARGPGRGRPPPGDGAGGVASGSAPSSPSTPRPFDFGGSARRSSGVVVLNLWSIRPLISDRM